MEQFPANVNPFTTMMNNFAKMTKTNPMELQPARTDMARLTQTSTASARTRFDPGSRGPSGSLYKEQPGMNGLQRASIEFRVNAFVQRLIKSGNMSIYEDVTLLYIQPVSLITLLYHEKMHFV